MGGERNGLGEGITWYLVVGLEVEEEGAGLLEGEGDAVEGRTGGEGGVGGGGAEAEVAGGGERERGGRGDLVALVPALHRRLHPGLPWLLRFLPRSLRRRSRRSWWY